MKIILASKSPRRNESLTNLGFEFEVITADTDESSDITDPESLVQVLAVRKGRAVQEKHPENDTLIISCDTVVSLDGEILGKPKNRADAHRMISGLQNTAHHVLSGIALCYIDAQGNRKSAVSHASTAVHFGPMSQEDIELYLDSGEPFDKAGAYAIQGLAGRWITGIEGDYFNVVGLPVNVMCDLAQSTFGIDLLRL